VVKPLGVLGTQYLFMPTRSSGDTIFIYANEFWGHNVDRGRVMGDPLSSKSVHMN
jgi:hypothetical protein